MIAYYNMREGGNQPGILGRVLIDLQLFPKRVDQVEGLGVEIAIGKLVVLRGKVVEVHYKEYLGALPWRGMQKHIVDKILSVTTPEE